MVPFTPYVFLQSMVPIMFKGACSYFIMLQILIATVAIVTTLKQSVSDILSHSYIANYLLDALWQL